MLTRRSLLCRATCGAGVFLIAGCTPAAYAVWEVRTSKETVEDDLRRVRALLLALTFEGRSVGQYDTWFGLSSSRYESFSLGERGPIDVEVRVNAAATTIDVVFSEMLEKRLSRLGSQHVDAIDAGLETAFGPERVRMTSRHS